MILYIYIYTCTERERDKERERYISMLVYDSILCYNINCYTYYNISYHDILYFAALDMTSYKAKAAWYVADGARGRKRARPLAQRLSRAR